MFIIDRRFISEQTKESCARTVRLPAPGRGRGSEAFSSRHVFLWVGCVEEAGVKIISRGMQVRQNFQIFVDHDRTSYHACHELTVRCVRRQVCCYFVTSCSCSFSWRENYDSDKTHSAICKVIRIARTNIFANNS